MNKTAEPKGKKEKRCCIDLGSSYFRMLSVEAEFGKDGTFFSNPVQERVYVGWGEEIADTGVISRLTMDRAADALERMSEDMVRRSDVRLTAVSTNALRVALNRDEVRKLLEDRTGMNINVLSERGEAFLGFAGATSDLREGVPVILADPGGTSTELAWGAAPEAVSFASIPVGTHTVRGNERSVSIRIESMLEDEGVPSGDSPLSGMEESPTIMFTGGTAVSLAFIWRQMHDDRYDGLGPVEMSVDESGRPVEMSADEFDLTGRRIAGLYRLGRERRLPLTPERIRLLLPGLAIIRGTVRALRAEKMMITTRDLRWGVVLGDGRTERGYLADEQESSDSR